MPKTLSVQNNFIRGLITESTGLNFPENAATSTENCVFSLIGDVTRRNGINYESNYQLNNIGVSNSSLSSFRWKNAGGDGETELLVQQIGSTLYFYQSTNSTVAAPLSTTIQASTVSVSFYQASGNTNNVSQTECQYATGNGYLFVFHPDCDPFYCTYNSGVITSNRITLQIRDFLGYYPEPGNLPVSTRPTSLTAEHQYNLENQGWTGAPSWQASFSNSTYAFLTFSSGTQILGNTLGNLTFTVQAGLSNITTSQTVSLTWSTSNQWFSNYVTGGFFVGGMSGTATGTVVSYSGTSLEIDVTSAIPFTCPPDIEIYTNFGNATINWSIVPGLIDNAIATFQSDVGVYPADCDIWWTFKDDTGAFNPGTTYGSVLTTSTMAPQGHFILNVFNQNQSGVSGISSMTNLSTTARPSNGTWFQGRVWYAGVNGAQVASGDQRFYTWTENIYFSQIITPGDITSFGDCYQTNDPTDQTLFDILATDGGVITIPGAGDIYRLFPIQNGMLVFAANGVWFITGSTGIGFTATDYTITKISSVQSISSTSFIDVMGLPFFWNEEGIYRVTPAQGQGIGLAVEPLTVGTILSFYNDIPLDSKVYVRGDYDPINYVLKWIYKGTQETGISDRYHYDSVLCFNIYNKAFYPYSVSSILNTTPYIKGIFYLNYPNSITAPDPGFKYMCSTSQEYTFAEENDDVSYLDWNAVQGQNYTSYFTTGYSLQGKGVMKYQPIYVYMYSRNDVPFAYTIQGVWDYSISSNSGKASSIQTVVNGLGQPNFGNIRRRHKIRGHGEVLQLIVSSVQGQPFDIIGWVIPNQVDAGI